MTTSAACPACNRPGNGLLCDGHYVNGRDQSCTGKLERDLGDVASIVADLDITMSRQDRVPSSGGAPSSPKGKEDDAGLSAIAHTRTPINFGAVQAADNLGNVLGTWARDVGGPGAMWATGAPAVVAAWMLLDRIDAIRRHPAVNEMADEIADAIGQARRVVDRPADRIYLGQCLFEEADVTCYEDIYAMPGASEVRCRVCGTTHPVEERRDWLMGKARDMLVTVKEASSYLGEIGAITISQASIRGYIHRQKISYKAPIEARRFRLGDLLAVIGDDQERKSA